MVLHKDRQTPDRYGCEQSLCGKYNATANDGLNLAMADSLVTCSYCLRMMERADGKAAHDLDRIGA